MKLGLDKRNGLMMNCLSPNSDSELILLIAMRTFSERILYLSDCGTSYVFPLCHFPWP